MHINAHPRSWATTSEIAIEAKSLAYNLIQLTNGVFTKEEQEETPPNAGGPSSVNN